MSSSESDNENVIVRRPRIFRERVPYNHMENSYEFNERFRMTFERFASLLEVLQPYLEHPTQRNHALTPHQQLQIALHWFGTGTSYHAVSDMHGVSKATVCRAIKTVVNSVNNNLLNNLVCWPIDVGEVVTQFFNLARMPLVCGAVDGTLINIDAPHGDEAAFVDRHGNHSINVMLVAGADLSFFYVNANWPGSVNDARVLRTSGLYRRMEGGWRPTPDGVLLGDSIYPLKSWLIPPIMRDEHNLAQQRFLRAHKSTRRVIECAIGVLKEKFSCLSHLRVDPPYACEIIKCCVALCNFAKEPRDLDVNDDNIENGNRNMDEDYEIGAAEKLMFFYNHFTY